eukprot:CAMPEP_0182471934 /NCGR_PEP_ID=MMETSP1319-20130603/21258_1 /TAXON_ID=172717 /ORGANISM="Bolidomonas pacifica, Strain RCC208" /LENGTH=174 /DNA_ID=CAMNT_0024672545 /DNA_START=29 /DNA_END=550 /DNA_ORIENTATION=+
MPPLYLLPDCPPEETLRLFNDPFWGYVWPGSYALHRYMHDNPTVASDSSSVLDFGCGCGLASLTAKRLGARRVVANDICAAAVQAAKLNAQIGDSRILLELSTEDLVGRPDLGHDLILAGDMFYDSELGAAVQEWLEEIVEGGARVLVGDPGRHALPPSLELLEEYDLPDWLRR